MTRNLRTSKIINIIIYRMKDEIIAGSFAGAVARLFTAPFDVIKIRKQLEFNPILLKSGQRPKVFQGLAEIIKQEGVLSLWKGNLSATYLWVTYGMFQFTSYSALKQAGEAFEARFDSLHQ